MVWGPKLLNNKQNHSLSALYLIYLHLYLHRYVFACACACVCRCTFMHLCIHMCVYICVPVLYLCLPEVPLRMICFEYWRLFFLLKVSAEAVKRYRSERLESAMEKRRQHLDVKAATTWEESPQKCGREWYWQGSAGLARVTIGMRAWRKLGALSDMPFKHPSSHGW